MNCFKTRLPIIVTVLVLVLPCGCSVRRMVSGAVDDLTDALYRQRDPELAREGAAPFLLAVDGMIGNRPDDPDLLLRGVQSYSAYAGAFTLGTDPDRAFVLFDQALEYGFRLWQVRFGWNDIRRMDLDRWKNELENRTVQDVPDLFWTANAWASWITVHPETTMATADLSYVVAVMERLLSLDETYQSGAVHLFFGTYYAVQPRGMGRDLDKSGMHFESAMRLAGPHAMLPKVL
ncbi:MAG TPA: TRAP transporter TatT component family protein, partial [bacterium]|nr:TRAP transporter TatT component family protein [bacterium]